MTTTASWTSAPVDAALFRQVFRRHAAGVAIVTTDAGRGAAGVTVTSLASLSAEPALLTFGINTTASIWPHLRDARSAVVHLLGAAHTATARTFATSGIDRFAAPTRWRRLPTGEPLLADATAWLRIAIEHRHPAGGSHLIIGRVEEAGFAEAGFDEATFDEATFDEATFDEAKFDEAGLAGHHPPLLYHDGSYHAL